MFSIFFFFLKILGFKSIYFTIKNLAWFPKKNWIDFFFFFYLDFSDFKKKLYFPTHRDFQKISSFIFFFFFFSKLLIQFYKKIKYFFFNLSNFCGRVGYPRWLRPASALLVTMFKREAQVRALLAYKISSG